MRWTVPRWPLHPSSTPRWLAAYVLLTLVTAAIPPARHVPPISPATLVYAPQDAALPLLLSPFLVPTLRALLSRALQISWLYSHLPATSGPSGAAVQPRQLLTTYGVLLAVRSLLGFVFTRSVGWKYPALLAPYALYEPLYGIVPLLVDTVLFGANLVPGKIGGHDTLLRFALLAVCAMLDGMPWSYASAAAIAGLSRLAHTFTTHLHSGNVSPAYASVHVEDEEDIMLPLPSPYFRPAGDSSRSYPHLTKSRIILTAFIAMGVCWIFGSTPQYLQASLSRSHNAPPPPSVHILMLTYPRDKDPTSDYMIDSIQSYLDGWAGAALAPSSTTLTVYAHAGPDGRHRAWGRARMFFDATQEQRAAGPALNFVMHPQDASGAPPSHYAHLADALRYAYAAAHEWTMVVEDDFALCGAWGARGIARVLAALGSTLVEGADADELVFPGIIDDSGDAEKKRARWRGAFVGTGGSGLILHHTLLPTLIVLLDLIPTLTASLAPYPQTPPDVLIQQCLSGEIALCSALLSSPSSPDDASNTPDTPDTPARSPYPALPRAVPVPDLPPLLTPSAPAAFLVPARMLMEHTGHALSTGGRTYAAGQWACRWRQPMLGNRGVSVLVV
ncbi:hypothetical protein PsYK624_033920 [Phanerochaete sordida]|uniref:Mannosyltransferase n=1 Tax=Phanerochaete sordida TaxID=48140 RepID=A0A9P3LA93_9APHY|nr:hypothetical protein PsYK624_033920 [Phanerochaete sordida]